MVAIALYVDGTNQPVRNTLAPLRMMSAAASWSALRSLLSMTGQRVSLEGDSDSMSMRFFLFAAAAASSIFFFLGLGLGLGALYAFLWIAIVVMIRGMIQG
jgi:hypothetical protein